MSWLQRRTESVQSPSDAHLGSRSVRTAFRRKRLLVFAFGIAGIAVICSPNVWVYWQLHTARRALLDGKPKVAVERLSDAASRFPDNAEIQYRLATAYRRSGNLDRVSMPLNKAMKLGWNKDDIERQTLLSIAQNGNVDSVDGRLKMIMSRGVNDEAAEEIYEALAIGYLKTYRMKEAWECLNSWGEWQPKAIFPKYWRADICRRFENPTAEEREYRDILAIDARHLDARQRLAEVLKDSNRVESAAREYAVCLEQDGNRPELSIGLAECQRRLGNVEEAQRLLHRVSQLKLTAAQRSSVLLHMGQIEADSGRWGSATENLEEAVRLTPYDAAALFALSQVYSSSGNELKSQELFNQSKHVRLQRERVEEITHSLIDQPGNADLRYEAGKILMDLGLKEDGAAWLQTALKIEPNHAGARSVLAEYQREKALPK